MGNFSRDTFDRLKNYVSVRLQQGVPIVDADWNELQDIRKHELEAFLKWFVGDGVPQGNDGFAIGKVTADNDFSIADGHCLAEGWDAVNDWAERHVGEPLRYSSQPLFGNAALVAKLDVDPLPPLTTPTAPTAQRTDTVYLDIWEREVDSREDTYIVNPDIGIETSVRTKREWAVRVAQGTAPPDPLAGHVHYPLATLTRPENESTINDINITDLRQTDLTLAGKVDRDGDHITGDLAVDGRLGIGTTDARFPVDCKGVIRALATGVTNPWPAPGPGLGAGVEMLYVDWEEPNRGLIQAHDRDAKENKPLYIDCETLALQSAGASGNVGIGTATPAMNLHIQGSGSAPLKDHPSDCPGLAITGDYPQLDLFGRANNGRHGPTIRIGSYDPLTEDSFKHWSIGTASGNSAFLDIGFAKDSPDPHSGIRNKDGKTVLTLVEDGNVGIGTTEPKYPVDSKGIIRALAPGDNPWHWPSGPGAGVGVEIMYVDWQGPHRGQITAFDRATAEYKPLLIDGKTLALQSHGGSGNVGIGTMNPQYPLEVHGTVAVHGSINAIGSGSWINTGILQVGGPDPHPDSGRATILLHHHSVMTHQLRYNGGNLFLERSFAGAGGTTDTPNLYVGGSIWSRGTNLSGADYAEYFESLSGKGISAGTSVVLVEHKIRPAKKSETPVGVISANPGVAGGVYTEWPGKNLRDELGNPIMEEYEEEVTARKKEKLTRERQKMMKKTIEEKVTGTEVVRKDGKYLQKEIAETVTREVEEPAIEEVDLYDVTGKTVIGKHRVPVMETYEEEIDVLDDDGRPVLVGTGKFETKERPKLNPDYDESNEYVPREKRPEWNCVGLLGKLPLRKGQPVAESWIKMKDISDEVELWLVK